jgi:hypothetical protein
VLSRKKKKREINPNNMNDTYTKVWQLDRIAPISSSQFSIFQLTRAGVCPLITVCMDGTWVALV